MGNRAELRNDTEEALRLAFDGRLSMLWTSFPGIVTSVDLEKNTCAVQPAIQGVIEDDNGGTTFVNLPVLVDVPIVWPKAGGFVLTFPLAANDEVLVHVASRCIDAWWQSGGIQKPMEARMHDLSDGFAYPGISSQPNVVANVSSTAVQLRDLAGTKYIEINASGIKLKASTINVEGNLVVTGQVTAGTPAVNLTSHHHTGVTSGPSNTGGPVG